MNIDPSFSGHVTTQDYQRKTVIDGVEIIERPFHNDDGGNFSELYRLNNGEIEGLKTPFQAKQISLSVMMPGVIKAYHLHLRQDDFWYVLPYNRLLVNLHDVREGSSTFNNHIRLVLGGGKNMMLRIPQGVAHGVANIYQQPMTLLYATSQQFNPQNPDEHRLPWDQFGADVWELAKG